jgi:hypothetical protein
MITLRSTALNPKLDIRPDGGEAVRAKGDQAVWSCALTGARRETLLTAMHQGLEAGLASTAAMPRVTSLESEYLLATATAQLTWLRSVIDDLRTGRLSWSEAELTALLDDRG